MGNGGLTVKGYKIPLWYDQNILKLVVVIVEQHHEYSKHHWTVHFERVNYMACEIYINEVANEYWNHQGSISNEIFVGI